MPHISKKKVGDQVKKKMDDNLIGFLVSTNSMVRKSIFKEILTKTERIMIAKRLLLIFFLAQKLTIYKISNLLKVSPSTVARFKFHVESGKYTNTYNWLKRDKNIEKVLKEILRGLSIPFRAYGKSFKKALDEEIKENYR